MTPAQIDLLTREAFPRLDVRRASNGQRSPYAAAIEATKGG